MTTWNELARELWLGSDRIAVLTNDVEWTGDELLRRAGGAAQWLASCGFSDGAGVPALIDETPTAVAVAVGAALSGRALAPLGTRLPPTDLAAAVEAFAGPGLVTTPEHVELATDVARRVGTQLHTTGPGITGVAATGLFGTQELLARCRPNSTPTSSST
jgi:acyl-CoA synthetase (AMP-forming)/AMP-acid ligase II